jgi:hypothetical protein
MTRQLELFHVQEAYARAQEPLTNEKLYESVAAIAGIPKDALNEQSEIGRAKVKRSKLKRTIRSPAKFAQLASAGKGRRKAGSMAANREE